MPRLSKDVLEVMFGVYTSAQLVTNAPAAVTEEVRLAVKASCVAVPHRNTIASSVDKSVFEEQ